MKMRAIVLCAAAAFLPFAVACSTSDNDDGGTKEGAEQTITVGGSTVGQLSETLQEAGMPEQQADCMAQAYEKLDLTEEQVQQLQQGDTSVLQGKDMGAYVKASADCLSQ